jgi:hypothetical protein
MPLNVNQLDSILAICITLTGYINKATLLLA